VTTAQDAASQFLTGHGIGDKAQFNVGLVLEEVLANIIQHGYDEELKKTRENDIGVEVRLSLADDGIILDIQDNGRPFNPLEVAQPVLPRTLGEAKIGGLGILLIRKAAQHLAYQWRDNRNCLQVSIPLR
jgi:anti-sigma regulatory factor (Ser/Thr protein kinase)